MFGRPSFGVSQPNTFGFGSGTSTSFGQPSQLFGGSSGTFGSGPSGFGSSSQPIFGAPQQSTAPLFGSSSTPAFGQSTQSSGFGSSLFGNTQQPSSSGGIFGSSAGTGFGPQSKSGGFGFPSSSSGGLFGQTTQTQQNASSMFPSASSSTLFGSSTTFGGAQTQTGTVNKFIPVTGTDSVQKSGVVQSINTKHHCITCMKEYENKSLEELRWEDYQANRKGPQQQPSFGTPSQPFGIASSSSGLFGQTESKPVFGQPSASFGQPNFGISSQTTASNIFGKPSTGFGNTSTTNSFTFGTGTSTTGPFGSSIASKPFAAPTNQPLFGPTQPQQNTFGTNTFGQPSTQPSTSNLFVKPTQQQGFNMGQSFQFGTQPQNSSNIFQTPKTNTTGFNVFGQPNTTTPGFGQQQQQQTTFSPFNSFGKPAQPTFGQPSQPIFGTGLNSSSIFGNNTNKNLFTPTTNLFGNSFQPNTGFTMQSQQPQQQPMLNMQPGTDAQPQDSRPFLQSIDPYGYSPHLEGLAPVKQTASTYTTNPKELQKYLEAPQPIAIVSPTTKRLKVFPPLIKKKANLFDDDIDTKTNEINFTLKRSAKRLVIRKNPEENKSLEVESPSYLIGSPNETTEIVSPPAFITPKRGSSFGDFSSSGLTRDIEKPVMVDKESQVNGLSNKSDKSNNSADVPVDTCGIILTRPEYYTVPPLEKLLEHKQTDGQCLVKGFTIGRVGYGNVSFPDLMDVANLNLDDLVHFRYRELTIYPDDAIKPPLGEGLNRRAQVTLDRVYPKGKVDRKLITDVQVLISINFSESLRALCDKHGTKFLDYRPETGSWVFMVEHFSKYKFTDSDEEETLVTPTSQEEKVDIEVQATLQTTPEFDIGNVDMTEYTSVESAVPTSDELHQVKTRRDLYQRQGDKLFLMKATLFEEDDYVPVNIERDNIETLSKSGNLLKDFARPLPATKRVEKIDRQRSHTFQLINLSCSVPLNRSYYNCRNYMDMAIFKSRSFRVGWGKGLILATKFNSLKNTEFDKNIRTNKVEIIDVSSITDYDPLLESLPGHLEIILETSNVQLVDNVPLFSINHDKGNLRRHQRLAKDAYMKNYNKRNVRYFSEIWDLIVALWAEKPSDQTRRELLSEWFQSVLARDVEKTVKHYGIYHNETSFERIFAHLTGYQIYEAADVAVRDGLPNLSLLISQVNFSTLAKPMLQYQIEQWRSYSALEHIDFLIQKIYMLLAGMLTYEDDSNITRRFVNVCENLNWKHCLGIILWYIMPSTDSIPASVNLYRQAFEKEGIAQRPFSEHINDETNIFDIQYLLILLHCNMCNSLEDILTPLTHTSYGADCRLSWIFLQILTALDAGVISESARNIITTSFSIQLESFGLTKWAVFVLLFIKDLSVRKSLVLRCLHRNLTANSSDQIENELVKDLHLPAEWIHEIKSYRTQLLDMHWHSYRHLAYTKLWYESHKIAMESIIPDLIINEKFDVIRKILEVLQQGNRRISTWHYQGGLLLDFLKIMDAFKENNQEFDKEEALNIHSALLELCTRLHYYPKKTSKQLSAISELSKRCYIYANLLLAFMKPTYQGLVQVTRMEVNRLVMPGDYIFNDINCEFFCDT